MYNPMSGSSLARALHAIAIKHSNRVFGAENISRVIRNNRNRASERGGVFDPHINRWTNRPHEHNRERARRTRQNLAHLNKISANLSN